MRTKYEYAEGLFFQGNYEGAFDQCKKIINAQNSSKEDKSDAYNFLAAIILGAAPYLANEHEGAEATKYLHKALEYNPSNIGAMLNIINFYGDSFHHINDLPLLEKTCMQLDSLSDEISDNHQALIENLKTKYKLVI